MTNKEYQDPKEENFVDKHTTHVAAPPEEEPFEVELTPSKKDSKESSIKEANLPNAEEPAEEISFEEVIPEDVPPRKNGSEDLPLDNKNNEKSLGNRVNRDTEDKANDNTPP